MNNTKTWRSRRPLGATLTLLLVAVTSTPARPGSGYRNPVYGSSFADPMVLRVGAEYYAYGTGVRFPVLRSPDLVHWTGAGTAMPGRPRWSSGNSWAPSVLPLWGRRCPDAPAASTSTMCFVMYYVGLNNALGTPANCIGVALADSPVGPFRDHGILTAAAEPVDPVRGPIGCGDERGYSNIDPAPFMNHDGLVYLYLSTGHDATGGWQRTISVIALTDDLLHAAGDRVELFSMTQRWEGDVVEGPWMTVHRNRYYLFYSGGRFTDGTYAMSYALANSPIGPFTKPADTPLLGSAANIIGPGGGSVIAVRPARDWLVYHARATAGGARTLRVDPLVWDDDATPPTLTVRGPSTTIQPAP